MASKTDSDLRMIKFDWHTDQVLSDKRPADSLGLLLAGNDD